MYKGNMRDFTDKVSDYLRRRYDCKLVFGHALINNSYFIAFFASDQVGATGYEVYDRGDFEEQVYDYVNVQLNGICIKEI